MSQGNTPNPVTPDPVTPGPSPVVVQKTWEDRLWNLLPIGAMILLMFAVNRGWLTKEQADVINKAIPIVVSAPAPADDGKAAVEISTGKDAAGADTVTVKPTLAAAPPELSIDDIDKWLPLVEKIATVVKPILMPDPKPAPTPTPLPGPSPSEQALLDQIARLQEQIKEILKPPAPTPIDPRPIPVIPGPTPIVPIPVVPGPGPTDGPKIVITDEQGKPITAATIDAGILFQVGSNVGGTDASWTVSRNGDVSIVTLANNAGYVCYLKPGAWVEFHLTDFGSRKNSQLRITCNKGPQPPPNPTPDQPTVDVKPTPKPAGEMRVFVVYESSQNHSRQQDLILASVESGKISEALNAKCSKGTDGRPNWRRWDKDIQYDSSSPMGKLFESIKGPAVAKGLPAVVVTCGEDSTVYPVGLNATEDSVISVLSCGAN